jgi:dolichol-phosphate mannosyltransferase
MVSMILATYNERDNVAEAVGAIRRSLGAEAEIVVVDDDSPDRTWEAAEALKDPRLKVIRRVGERGLASAFIRGIEQSRGEVVGWFDCDMADVAVYLPAMIEKLSAYDVVIGSRYVPGGKDLRGPMRALSSRLINGWASLVLGGGIRDYNSGFVVLRRAVFDRVSLIPTGFGEYFIEFMYDCRRNGLKVFEMPYVLTERQKGVSKAAGSLLSFLWTGLGYGLQVVRTRLKPR